MPNSNLVRDEDLDLGDWGYDDATVRTDADDDPPDEADAGDGAAAVSGNGTVGDGASDAGADEESADSAGTDAVGFTRESLMLSGLVTLALWSAIWLACTSMPRFFFLLSFLALVFVLISFLIFKFKLNFFEF